MSVERLLVERLGQKGLSERRACRCLGSKRSSIRYAAKAESPLNIELRSMLRNLATKNRRFGAPRMSAILKRSHGVNHKRVHRLWQSEKLLVPRKVHRRRPSTPPWERPRKATRPNEVWTLDFVHHRTEYGQKLKMLVVLDEFSRECFEIRVEKRMRHADVLEVLDQLIWERGAPMYLRSDNGAEFIAWQLQAWLRKQGVIPIHIEPGSPWQNGYVESFNGKFRDECLNMELFFSRAEAQVIVDRYRESYNTVRPHSSLGYLAPLDIVARHQAMSPNNGLPGTNIPGGQKLG